MRSHGVCSEFRRQIDDTLCLFDARGIVLFDLEPETAHISAQRADAKIMFREQRFVIRFVRFGQIFGAEFARCRVNLYAVEFQSRRGGDRFAQCRLFRRR